MHLKFGQGHDGEKSVLCGLTWQMAEMPTLMEHQKSRLQNLHLQIKSCTVYFYGTA